MVMELIAVAKGFHLVVGWLVGLLVDLIVDWLVDLLAMSLAMSLLRRQSKRNEALYKAFSDENYRTEMF